MPYFNPSLPYDVLNGYELVSKQWSHVHTVEIILLSIISMMSSPNDEFPTNIDAVENQLYDQSI
jgi:ubiquitin-protein ligase